MGWNLSMTSLNRSLLVFQTQLFACLFPAWILSSEQRVEARRLVSQSFHCPDLLAPQTRIAVLKLRPSKSLGRALQQWDMFASQFHSYWLLVEKLQWIFVNFLALNLSLQLKVGILVKNVEVFGQSSVARMKLSGCSMKFSSPWPFLESMEIHHRVSYLCICLQGSHSSSQSVRSFYSSLPRLFLWSLSTLNWSSSLQDSSLFALRLCSHFHRQIEKRLGRRSSWFLLNFWESIESQSSCSLGAWSLESELQLLSSH